MTPPSSTTPVRVMASKVYVYAGNMDFIALTDQMKWAELKTNNRTDDDAMRCDEHQYVFVFGIVRRVPFKLIKNNT